MKADLKQPESTHVALAIKVDESLAEPYWTIHLVNQSNLMLEQIMVTATGYSPNHSIKTSTLRHRLANLPPKKSQQIEVLSPQVFDLQNQYLVSYFIDGRLYDKKFVIKAGTIKKGLYV